VDEDGGYDNDDNKERDEGDPVGGADFRDDLRSGSRGHSGDAGAAGKDGLTDGSAAQCEQETDSNEGDRAQGLEEPFHVPRAKYNTRKIFLIVSHICTFVFFSIIISTPLGGHHP
jgi:hypothetical protein